MENEENGFSGFYFFRSYFDAIMDFEEAGDTESQLFLFKAITKYIFLEEEPQDYPNPFLKSAWRFLKPNLDESRRIELEKQAKREAGRKGGIAKAKQNGSRSVADAKQNCSRTVAEGKQSCSKDLADPLAKGYKDKDKDKDKDIFFKDDKSLVTFAEAEAYKKEKGYASDLEQCKSYWELNGWTYKGLPLTDWQQVIDYWEKGYQKHKKKKSKSFDNFEQRFISDDDFKGLEKALMKGGTT